jgi:hypothetical protein
MRKAMLVLLFIFATLTAAPLYNQVCSPCGSMKEPKACSGFSIIKKPCELQTYGFVCAKTTIKEGILLCPSCPSGYELERCESSWFGLIKRSICIQPRKKQCGEMCDINEDVLSFFPCTKHSFSLCCNIPNNNISIKLENQLPVLTNENIELLVKYWGVVKQVVLELGDGRKLVKSVNTTSNNITNNIEFNITYSSPGYYRVIAKAYSCIGCTKPVISKDSTTIIVK